MCVYHINKHINTFLHIVSIKARIVSAHRVQAGHYHMNEKLRSVCNILSVKLLINTWQTITNTSLWVRRWVALGNVSFMCLSRMFCFKLGIGIQNVRIPEMNRRVRRARKSRFWDVKFTNLSYSYHIPIISIVLFQHILSIFGIFFALDLHLHPFDGPGISSSAGQPSALTSGVRSSTPALNWEEVGHKDDQRCTIELIGIK